jgi:hypothetical protein
MNDRHAFLRAPLGAAIALLLAACGGGAETRRDSATAADSASNATAAATGTTPANDEIDVEELHLGRALKPDSTVAEDTDDFRTGDTIWAVMETDANESGKQVVVRWTMDDGDQIVHEEPRMVATGDKARTVFRGKAGGWAPGKYHVRIMYNGKETKSAEFEVK